MNPEKLLDAKMTKLKLFYFGYKMRSQHSLGKIINLGKTEGNKKRGRSHMRGIDSIMEAMGMILQELSRAIEERTLWTSLIHRTWS